MEVPFLFFVGVGIFPILPQTQENMQKMPRNGNFESPLVYPYPKNRENSDHGLSFSSPETQTMVRVSPFPGKYRVWGGLGFSPSFSRTMV